MGLLGLRKFPWLKRNVYDFPSAEIEVADEENIVITVEDEIIEIVVDE
jgi:hypothetical protein